MIFSYSLFTTIITMPNTYQEDAAEALQISSV